MIYDLSLKKAPRCLSGAPNITGEIGRLDDAWGKGAFAAYSNGGVGGGAGGGACTFDASRCSPVYGRQADLIVPQHYVTRWYIRYR